MALLLDSEELNSACDPASRLLRNDDMSFPISYYWINSSHNTYLTGHQVGPV